MQKRKVLAIILAAIVLLTAGFILWEKDIIRLPFSRSAPTPTPASKEISLSLVKEYNTDLEAFGKQVSSGSHIYLTYLGNYGINLAVFGVADVLNPKKIFTSDNKLSVPSKEVEAMYLKDSYLYLSGSTVTDETWMAAYDISDPSKPKFTWFQDGLVERIVSADNYLFLLGSKFWVFDISNPAKPILLSTRETNDIGTDAMCVSGSYAYLGGMFRGISIMNVSDKKNPVLVGKDSGATEDLFCIGNIIYQMSSSSFASSKNRVIVLDASDPINLKLLKVFEKEELQNFYQIGSNFFVTYKGGVLVFDISNPANPVLKKDIPGEFGLISGQGKYLYSIIGDPSSPRNSILKIYEIK